MALFKPNFIILICLFILPLEALPFPESKLNGKVEYEINENELVLYPADQTILNFDNFEIQSGETVTILTEDPSHRVLLRINENARSQIEGKLVSNGTLYIISPKEIIVDSNASITADRLYLISAHLDNEDFLQENDRFTDATGSIEVYGSLSAKDTVLMGKSLLQTGIVCFCGPDSFRWCDEGNVFYITSKNILLGKENGQLYIDKEIFDQKPIEFDEDRYSAFLQIHTGITKANHIQLFSESAITIQGMDARLDTSSYREGIKGGDILIQGQIILIELIEIKSCGLNGGGKVLIGVIEHEGKFFPHAQYLKCESNIYCDAINSGDGGEIVLGAEKLMALKGKISTKTHFHGGKKGRISFFGSHIKMSNRLAQGDF